MPRAELVIGLALAGLMTLTRSHHFASALHLPDASWAVFFLAGAYLRPAWALPALLALAAGVDLAAIRFGGVAGSCLSPAYVLLAPAYGALWLAGRWYARRHRLAWSTLGPLGLAVTAGTLACELLSSGGFYFLSGRFAETGLAEFAARLLRYFPADLQAVAFYVGLAAVLHLVLALARGAGRAAAPGRG